MMSLWTKAHWKLTVAAAALAAGGSEVACGGDGPSIWASDVTNENAFGDASTQHYTGQDASTEPPADSESSVSTMGGLEANSVFGAPSAYFHESATEQFLVADTNGDGHLDLVNAGSTVSVLLGKSDGTFGPTPVNSDGIIGGGVTTWALGDVDGDKKIDLVVSAYGDPPTTPHNLSTFLGNGDGSFRTGKVTSALFDLETWSLGDVTKDGKADLLVLPGPYVFPSNGDGTFAGYATFTGAGSANADAGADAAAPLEFLRTSASTDLNADGIADLVWSESTATSTSSYVVRIALGTSAGTLGPTQTVTLTQNAFTIQFADTDKNGSLDIVLGVFAGMIILPNDGNGAFSSQVPVLHNGLDTSGSTGIGDLNHDGNLDFLVSNQNSAAGASMVGFFAFYGAGDNKFPTVVGYPQSGGSSVEEFSRVQLDDFNGDGYADVLALDENATDYVFLNKGAP